MILSDVIIHGLTACIAFILQIIIFKVTTQRPLRYWIIILAGIAIFASSYFGSKIRFYCSCTLSSCQILQKSKTYHFGDSLHTFHLCLNGKIGHFPDYSNFFPCSLGLLFCWSLYSLSCFFTLVCTKCSSSGGLLSNDAN